MGDSARLINYHIEELKDLENLTERTKNVSLENELDTLYKLVHYYQINGSFLSLKNCGLKTNVQLNEMAEKYIQKFSIKRGDLDLPYDQNKFESLRFYCFTKFNIPSEEMESYKTEFLSHAFPFFKFIGLIIKHLLSEREKYIFERNFGFILGTKKLTLQAIGDKYGITRERVRQIAQKIPVKVENALASFAGEYEEYFNYNIRPRKEVLLIDQRTAEFINKGEDLNFSPKFYAFAFATINSKMLFAFQNIEEIYHNYFLVHIRNAELFNFEAYFNDLALKTGERIEKRFEFNFDSYLKQFRLAECKSDQYHKIKFICRRIATLEFNVLFEGTSIIFERNTMVRLSEYIMDILVTANRPLRLVEIARDLRSKSPKMPPNLESLRSTILSIPGVIAIGKTSTYALDSWTHIRKGTIKDIVREYLESMREPVHISELTAYVNKYRKTTDKNIYSNMKLDRDDTFVFFKKGYVGLSKKTYGHQDINGQLSLL